MQYIGTCCRALMPAAQFTPSRQKCTRSAVGLGTMADAKDAHGVLFEREQDAVITHAQAGNLPASARIQPAPPPSGHLCRRAA